MIYVVLRVACDACRREKGISFESLSATMRESFKKFWSEQGWVFPGDKCYCPECVRRGKAK